MTGNMTVAGTGTENTPAPVVTTQTVAAGGTPASSEPTTKLPKWVYDRIDTLTKQRNEAQADAEAARKKLAEKPAEGDTKKPDVDPAEINRLVNARAAQMLFERQATAMFSQGKAEFPDFEETLGTFKTLGGMPPEMLEAAIELGDGHKILYNLARDPAEAHRVMTLPAVARIAAMTKYSTGAVKAAGNIIPANGVSKAGNVVTPVVGNGTSATVDLGNPNTSMRDWAAAREAQKKARAGTR